jgi:hypothetical protein
MKKTNPNKARSEQYRTKTRIKVRPGWRDKLAHQIGALGSPGRFIVAGGGHCKVGIRHFSV